MSNPRLRTASRLIFVLFASFLVGYIVFQNLAPLGTSKLISTVDSAIIFTPPNRVAAVEDINGSQLQKLQSDIVYFSTDMPLVYDKARVKIRYKNTSDYQSLMMGFQDQGSWHYNSQLIDAPLLNTLIGKGWNITNTKPALLQKNIEFKSFDDFLFSPPEREIIGTYNFDLNIFRQANISDYSPSSTITEFNTPLRGKIVFYTFLSDEPFKLNVAKKDLNFYSDPDVVSIKIYKENDVVYSAQIDDDGVMDDSHSSSPAQEVYIQNPGPGLPEPGVYKVVVDAGSDSVITKMTTNLHKIVFDSPIYPVSNHEVYPNIADQTQSNKLFSDAKQISAITYHEDGKQKVQIGSESAQLEVKTEFQATPSADELLTEINLPRSDVQLKGKLGHFAFSPEHFFQPTRIKLQPINDEKDLEGLSYIVTDYKPPSQEEEWKVAEVDFDLRTAYVKNRKLSWIIKALGLKENGNEVVIKSIDIDLIKTPMFKLWNI